MTNLLSSLLLVARFARCLKLKLLRGASTGRAGGFRNQKEQGHTSKGVSLLYDIILVFFDIVPKIVLFRPVKGA